MTKNLTTDIAFKFRKILIDKKGTGRKFHKCDVEAKKLLE